MDEMEKGLDQYGKDYPDRSVKNIGILSPDLF